MAIGSKVFSFFFASNFSPSLEFSILKIRKNKIILVEQAISKEGSFQSYEIISHYPF